MTATELTLRNVGPVKEAALRFGDLTVLVGPQASGKSICLQFFKLMLDLGAIQEEMEQHGLVWRQKKVKEFLSIYLGEGMESVWDDDRSRIWFDGSEIDLQQKVIRRQRSRDETMFFVPAQRVITIARGWPRPFSEYAPGDPYCVRDFSEKTRRLMEEAFGSDSTLFPQPQRLNQPIREVIADAFFGGFELGVDTRGHQKRLTLHENRNGKNSEDLPFMVWSAGQREFVPLLLGAYWLCPAGHISTRDDLKWVVIEEIEMGLHPRGVIASLVIVLELIRRGYRVCLSTHSSDVLDVMWALRLFQENKVDPKYVLKLFGLRQTGPTKELAEKVLNTDLRVYSFDRHSGVATDISTLDPASSDERESGWGGLTEFSGRVSDLVAEVVND